MCSVVQSCLSLCDPVDCSPPGSSSSWSVPCNTGVQFPAPGDLPSPEIEPLMNPCIADGSAPQRHLAPRTYTVKRNKDTAVLSVLCSLDMAVVFE